jgi:hypothetical protein
MIYLIFAFAAATSSLREIMLKYGTDKGYYHEYFRTYEPLFAPLREDRVRILEIGVDGGKSIAVWNEYFQNAELIVGIGYGRGFRPQSCSYIKKARCLLGDQSDTTFLDTMLHNTGGAFHIIIDDGSHVPGHQLTTLMRLFRYDALQTDGLYIVEDIETSYYKSGVRLYGYQLNGTGKGAKGSFVEQSKEFVDVVNREFFDSQYQSTVSGVDHRIQSVLFAHNVIVFRAGSTTDVARMSRPYRWPLRIVPTTATIEREPSCTCPPLQVENDGAELRNDYLELLKNALTGDLLETSSVKARLGVRMLEQPYNADTRANGRDWPRFGYTMVGKRRLDALHDAIASVSAGGVDGDFIECGVWRGGTSIFARLAFNAYRQTNRIVYVADSFAGLPPSRSTHDRTTSWDHTPYLEVSLETVQRHFRHFGGAALRNTVFVKGFFNDTLPVWRDKISKLAILRLDGDMYESCADIMANLYDKVSIGGYVFVDDWFGFPCKPAVESFLSHHHVTPTVVAIDSLSVYFVKRATIVLDPDWYADFLNTKRSTA